MQTSSKEDSSAGVLRFFQFSAIAAKAFNATVCFPFKFAMSNKEKKKKWGKEEGKRYNLGPEICKEKLESKKQIKKRIEEIVYLL